MKIDGNTIIFKSIPEFFDKEMSGVKSNTARTINTPELNQILDSKYISIVNLRTNENFTRQISDISIIGALLGSHLVVISWNPNEVIA